ncbi:MAG: substrate-binding domain-containing protein, partial [Propionicimonas sp.]|nr:substrate-binding domain-containing protein [Propionicimonas sp.]
MKKRILAAGVACLLLAACSTGTTNPSTGGSSTTTPVTGNKVRIAMIPTITGIPYFQTVKQGVDEAAAELGDQVEVIWTGPTTTEASAQVSIVQNMINAKVDVIAIAANDKEALAPVLQQALDAGIHVMTWSDDASVREINVQLIDPDVFGATLVDQLVEQTGEQAHVAVLSATPTSPNQTAWLAGIKKRIAEAHSGVVIDTVEYVGEDQEAAMNRTKDLIRSNPNLNGIITIVSPALPGAAQAIESMGVQGKVALVGNSLPNGIRQYFKTGTLKKAILWNPIDDGYLNVYTALALAK